MTITITNGSTYEEQLKMKCNHPAFIEKYGNSTVWTSRKMLFANMKRIACWCNNEAGEECSFAVE